MPRSFLSLPREVRDQIYGELLACCANVTTLPPPTTEVIQSTTILRTCKQIQKECKETIWRNNNMRLREPTELFTRLGALTNVEEVLQIQHIKIYLELLDRDELEWICSGLKALSKLRTVGALRSITLIAINDRPRNIKEYKEDLNLIYSGQWLDGRQFGTHAIDEADDGTELVFGTSWPHFLHWGRRRWLREMLLNRSEIADLLQKLRTGFKGHIYVNGLPQSQAKEIDPRDGEITIIIP